MTDKRFYDWQTAGGTDDVMRFVACLERAVVGKIAAWRDPRCRQSKRVKDLGDIIRLIEAHPQLWSDLPDELKEQIDKPEKG